jgi:hypothetical protein
MLVTKGPAVVMHPVRVMSAQQQKKKRSRNDPEALLWAGERLLTARCFNKDRLLIVAQLGDRLADIA